MVVPYNLFINIISEKWRKIPSAAKTSPYGIQEEFGVLLFNRYPDTKKINPKKGPFLKLNCVAKPIGVSVYALPIKPMIYKTSANKNKLRIMPSEIKRKLISKLVKSELKNHK